MSLSLFSLLSVYWCSYLSNELGINQWPLTLENGCEWCRYNICRHSLGQMPWDWDVLHCRLQSKPQGLHHLTERVTGKSHRKQSTEKNRNNRKCRTSWLCYLGLHSVRACNKLSVTSSLFGQPVDESRARSLTNPKRETSATQLFSCETCKSVV